MHARRPAVLWNDLGGPWLKILTASRCTQRSRRTGTSQVLWDLDRKSPIVLLERPRRYGWVRCVPAHHNACGKRVEDVAFRENGYSLNVRRGPLCICDRDRRGMPAKGETTVREKGLGCTGQIGVKRVCVRIVRRVEGGMPVHSRVRALPHQTYRSSLGETSVR